MVLCATIVSCALLAQVGNLAPAGGAPKQDPPAPSRIVVVTVFPDSARITREVALPEGEGIRELRVGPLPGAILPNSVSGEGDATRVRIISVRHQVRPREEDARQAIRGAQDRAATLRAEGEKLKAQVEVAKENLGFVSKLEGFSESALNQLTDKGLPSADVTIQLADHIMATRAEQSKQRVELELKVHENQSAIEEAEKALAASTTSPARTDQDAILLVEKLKPGPATVRLSYRVGAAKWTPRYRLRAGGDNDPVQATCLADISQESGEDWEDVALSLSTAEAHIAATPPALAAVEIEMGEAGDAVEPPDTAAIEDLRRGTPNASLEDRAAIMEEVATMEQSRDLLSPIVPAKLGDTPYEAPGGAGVVIAIPGKHALRSGGAVQTLQVARFEAAPEWYYATTPILSNRVFRMAHLTNANEWALLSGPADMYRGDEFAGRMELPQVPAGERFTVGFGADPQVGVHRRLVAHTGAVQGGNRVEIYEYRIRLHNFKPGPIKVQVWDRLPRSRPDEVAVNLDKVVPPISEDAVYLRRERPDNLLRWDVEAKAGENKENALTITYQFKLEFSRDRGLGGLSSTSSSNPAALPGGMGGMGGMFSRGTDFRTGDDSRARP